MYYFSLKYESNEENLNTEGVMRGFRPLVARAKVKMATMKESEMRNTGKIT